jgi:3-hydroxyisobutyrate dehydrogenase
MASLRIGWVGVGVMGRHMASHLMTAGHSLSVYSRTASKCAPLVDAGARLALSPADAAHGADVCFTMVGAPDDVEAVTLGTDGVLQGLAADSLLVDCTTSTPSLAQTIAERAAAQGVLSLDAPVSGGDVGARAGTLSIMAGGSAAAMERARPLLETFGNSEYILHMGEAGAGMHTKMCNVRAPGAHVRACCARRAPADGPSTRT